jgi:hypothetical protein
MPTSEWYGKAWRKRQRKRAKMQPEAEEEPEEEPEVGQGRRAAVGERVGRSKNDVGTRTWMRCGEHICSV